MHGKVKILDFLGENILKNEVKKSQKSQFKKKLFFQALVEFFLEVLRAYLRYLIGTPSIRLCSRKEIRGDKHVYKKIFTKNRFGPRKNALFRGPDTDIVGKSHDVQALKFLPK